MSADVETAVPVQCEYKTERGRQCKLLVDPATGAHVDAKPDKHKFVIRKAPEEKPVLPKGVRLKAQIIPIDGERIKKQVGAGAREAEPRDEHQRQVDADVKAIYEEWIRRGRPNEVEKWPQGVYVVPPEAVDAVLDMLRKTMTKGGPAYGKSTRYTRGTHKSGNALIAFSCADKPQKPPAA